MKKWIFYLSVSAGLFASYLVGVWLYALYVPIVTESNGATYYLRHGVSKKVLIGELTQQGIIKHPYLIYPYVLMQNSPYLKTGEYSFAKGSTLQSILKQVMTGTGLVYHPFTIIPGWTFSQLRTALIQTPGLHHFLSKMKENELMAYLGEPNQSTEGQFYPETYYFTRGISDLIILKRASNLMKNKLELLWQTRAPKLPYENKYQALIAASLIEKEAYLNSERPIIAGVLINRLQKNMLLQFDPTVIYGLGEHYDGKIHKKDLLTDTAYNTYLRKGLPPTPIAIPSIASIKAALHPLQSDYLYFVAVGDGSHRFSKTLEEHNTAVTNIKKHNAFFNETKVQKYLHRRLAEWQPSYWHE